MKLYKDESGRPTMEGSREALLNMEKESWVRTFGKMWETGDDLRVLYPVYTDRNGQVQIMVASGHQHNVDIKALRGFKRFSIPSSVELGLDNKVTKEDLPMQFARLSRLLLDGEKNMKEAKILENRNLDTSAQRAALDDFAEEMKEKRPVVGRRLLVTITECLVYKIDASGNPINDPTKLGVASQDMSKARLTALNGILDKPQYHVEIDPETGTGYVEISMSMGSSGKRTEDGKVTPAGLSEAYYTKKQFPEFYAEVLEPRMSGLPASSDVIRSHHTSFWPYEEGKLMMAMMSYVARNSDYIEALGQDEANLESIKSNAVTLHRLGIGLNVIDVPAAAEEYLSKERDAEVLVDEEGSFEAVIEESEGGTISPDALVNDVAAARATVAPMEEPVTEEVVKEPVATVVEPVVIAPTPTVVDDFQEEQPVPQEATLESEAVMSQVPDVSTPPVTIKEDAPPARTAVGGVGLGLDLPDIGDMDSI